MPSEDTFNTGCQILAPVADLVGLSVDKVRMRIVSLLFQINFVLCLLVSLPISFVYRVHIRPQSRNARLAYPMVAGWILCAFLYGR